MSGAVAGYSRYHMRARVIALQELVGPTAQMSIRRVMTSKTRMAIGQLELKSGDQVDFWRKPAAKDDSCWRGPATVVQVGTPIVIRGHGHYYNVQLQDLRRAVVYLFFLMYSMLGDMREGPNGLLITFAEQLSG